MGVYYSVVNPLKKQYLDPYHFGEAIKWTGLLRGEFCVVALKYLISDSHGHSHEERINLWDLEGTWVGDPVIITGDESSPSNPDGIITATEEKPLRNLYFMACDEFYNISHLSLAMLSENCGMAEEITNRAEEDELLFMMIGDLLMQIQPAQLKQAFESRFGPTWPKRYREYFEQRKWHKPLPIYP